MSRGADDDGVIDDHEIEEMRNYARLTALVGNRELVSALAEFVSAVEESGSITREEDRGSSSRFPSTSSHVDSSLDEPPQFHEVRRLDGIISPQQILHYFVTSLFSGDYVSVYVLDSKQIGAQDVCEQLLPSYHVDPSAVSESKPLCSGGLVYNACHSSQGFQKGASRCSRSIASRRRSRDSDRIRGRPLELARPCLASRIVPGW